MEATEELKHLREELSSANDKVKKIEAENARFRKMLGEASGEVNRLRGLLSSYNRLDVLMGLTDKATKYPKMFPVEFTNMVKYELMYLVNGYDPKGLYNGPEEDGQPEDLPATGDDSGEKTDVTD